MSLIRIYKTVFVIWMVILLARSAQYVVRIFAEFSAPPPPYQPEIVPCLSQPEKLSGESQQLFYYRSLGVICPK